jgi:hypothetical protein
MPIVASLAALAVACPPRVVYSQPIVVCPPVVWVVDCPPALSRDPKSAEGSAAPRDTKPKTEKPTIKPVTESAPKAPGELPKLDVPPPMPKPAPKIEIELPPVPKPADTIIPKPADLPVVPPPTGNAPKLPDALSPTTSTSGYRPNLRVVAFPEAGSAVEVTIYNTGANSLAMTVAGTAVVVPAKTRRTITVTGELWWQTDGGDRQSTTQTGGSIELYSHQ